MTASDPSDAVARGMQAQLARRREALAAGARPVGWKIGFNGPAIQEHLGLTAPVVGHLLDTGLVDDGALVALAGWTAPVLEVEVAIRVGEDGTVAGLAPALELADLDRPPDDLEAVLAGNVYHRGVVFGPEAPGVDPGSVAACVTRTGRARPPGGQDDDPVAEVVGRGRIAEDPAATVVFVRSFLARHGAALEPGDRIIGGSVVPPVPVEPGDAFSVDFGPLGSLSIRFAR